MLHPPARRGPGWALGSVRAAAPRRGTAPGCATPSAAGTGGAAPAPNPAPAASRCPQGAPAVGQPRGAGLRCRAGGGGSEGGRGSAAAVGESSRGSGAGAGRPLRAARGEAAGALPDDASLLRAARVRSGSPSRAGGAGTRRGAGGAAGLRGERGAAGSGASAEDGASTGGPLGGPPRRVAPGRFEAVSPAPRNPPRGARGGMRRGRGYIRADAFPLFFLFFCSFFLFSALHSPPGTAEWCPHAGNVTRRGAAPARPTRPAPRVWGARELPRGTGGVGCGLPLAAQQALEAGFPIVIFKRENLLMESPE